MWQTEDNVVGIIPSVSESVSEGDSVTYRGDATHVKIRFTLKDGMNDTDKQ